VDHYPFFVVRQLIFAITPEAVQSQAEHVLLGDELPADRTVNFHAGQIQL
jgi:hypothetical protein